MDAQEMDRELKRAWSWLLKWAHGDEEVATDAFPWVWRFLSETGGPLGRWMIRRALWRAQRKALPGMYARGRHREDALPMAANLTTYSKFRARGRTPLRLAEVREAVHLVKRCAQTPIERRIIAGFLLGVDRQTSRGRLPDNTERTKNRFQWLRQRCRKTWPSLIGIA